ncbi:hypothetical protein DZC72_04300 [Maribacter algicola]|uniref:Uncharacterized protein n=1 Tax=Maribacter algicola TaxID=2498892 RepID=A0A3R8WGX2_9FLAO|nr:hypothetical protein DZC72_04300 [Maribacter algicola]
MDKMCIKVKGNKDINTIYIGERRLDVIEGLGIKKYMPNSIMEFVLLAMDDMNLKWADEVIMDCKMVIFHYEFVSVMYKHTPINFDGTLLFNFTISNRKFHGFSFPKKWKHLDFYLRTKRNEIII